MWRFNNKVVDLAEKIRPGMHYFVPAALLGVIAFKSTYVGDIETGRIFFIGAAILLSHAVDRVLKRPK
jgi:hypothetical protein